jgi:hypothetical protein
MARRKLLDAVSEGEEKRQGIRLGRKPVRSTGRKVFRAVAAHPNRVELLCAIFEGITHETAELMFRYPQEVSFTGGIVMFVPPSWQEIAE